MRQWWLGGLEVRKRTKRKVYNLINPITHAIEGAALLEKHRLDSLRLIELTAIEAFAKGKAGRGEMAFPEPALQAI
jgi:hypothetical protein